MNEQIKIKKIAPRAWVGVGFGDRGASYAVANHPEIRVIRESHGWTAFVGSQKLFGVTKTDLEFQIATA